MNRDKLLLFYEVATLKSVTKAADKLESNPPTVSRILKSIEEEVGSDLFTSYPKRMTLTRQGEIFLGQAKRLLLEYEKLNKDLKSSPQEMEGEFNISTNTGVISLIIFDALKDFIKEHQNISFSFTETDIPPDFALRESDIDIRSLRKNEKDIEAHYLRTDTLGLYASEDYLVRQGTIESLNDFKKHALLVFPTVRTNQENDNPNWHLLKIPAWNRKIAFQSTLVMKRAIENGLGVGPLSVKEAENSSTRLIPILPNLFTTSKDLYFMYPDILSDYKVVTELYNHLKRVFSLEEETGKT